MRVIVILFFLICLSCGALCHEKDIRPKDFLEKLSSKNILKNDDLLSLQDSIIGNFIDISYDDSSMASWQPSNHLERLKLFSEAYICPQSIYYQSLNVYNRICKGISYWINKNPISNNWWYNKIRTPIDLGQILINMRNGDRPLPLKLEQDCIDKMKDCVQDPYQYVGANRTDIATHWIYRACLTDDDELFKYAIDLVAGSIRHSRSEGIMIDNSYCQHERQIYMGAYGSSFLLEATKWAYLVVGTKFEFPKEKIQLLSNFARKTYFSCIRGNHYSYNVCGRSISRQGSVIVSGSPKVIAQRLIKLDPTHQDEYTAIIKDLNNGNTYDSKSEVSHTHFFYTDYTLHSCPKYTFDIRMSSKRTPRCESINNENLKNYFLSNGETCLLLSGKEFENIFPVWDWSRIPGVTAPHITNVPTITGFTTYGENDFAGGVSDSIHGASAYIYQDGNMRIFAKKSWFFMDNTIVCLGSDINSVSEYPVETSINQCFDNSKCFIRSYHNNQISELGQCQDSCISHPKMIVHGDVGYYFPILEDIIILKGKKTGSWYDINRRYDKSVEDKEVFYIGISHGKYPRKSRYSYILIPGIGDMTQLEKEVKNLGIKILNYDEDKHIVYDSHTGILQAVFYKPGYLRHDRLFLQVNKPCALIVNRNHSDRPKTLHVANICQTEEDISILMKYNGLKKNIVVKTKDIAYAGRTQWFHLW